MNQIFLSQNLNFNLQTFYVNINPQISPFVTHPTPNSSSDPKTRSAEEPTDGPNNSTAKEKKETESGSVAGKGLANSAMFDPIRYKTEMCKNYQELGHCKFGKNCYYAHFAHELKAATYKHKNYKTQLCKPFHLEGFCDFGSRCAFIHSKPDLDDILKRFETFLSSAPPMPRFDDRLVDEELVACLPEEGKDEKPIGDDKKRLKVFENFSQ